MGTHSGGVPPPDEDDCRIVLEATSIGTWHWDGAEDCLVLSAMSRALLGAPPEIGDLAAFIDQFHPEDRSNLAAALRDSQDAATLFELECRALPRPGAERWLRVRGSGRSGPGRQAVRGILMESGPHKVVEMENSHLAAIVTSTDDAVIGKTLEGIITDWNPGAEAIFGYAAQEVIGQPITILAVPDREADMPAILARIRNGERVEHYETQRRRKDGTIIDMSITVSPVYGVSGRIIGVSKVARDITLVRRAQSEVAEREAFLASVLETAPEAMIVMGADGIIQLFSAAAERLFGYAAAEAIGRHLHRLVPAADAGARDDDTPDCTDRAGLPAFRCRAAVMTGLKKDGSIFPMQLIVGEAHSGNRHFFTAFALDLTERRRTEKTLQELQLNLMQMSRLTALGEMASSLAHELNQPLTAIASYLQGSRLLLASGKDGVLPAVRDAVHQAAEQALRAGQVIRSLRNFLARGQSERTMESLSRIIDEAGALALLGVREDGITVALDLAADADRVSCNKVQIQQVLLNLIRNAAEAMQHAAVRRLLLASRRVAPDLVELSVHDTGHGVSPEIRDKLFQPFVTTKPRGMGVGLSLSRTIVEAHGGRLWVEDEPAGGSVFRLTLRQSEPEERADDL